MNFKLMRRLIAQILVIEAAFMVPPLLICLFDREPSVAFAFLKTMVITLVAAGLLALGTHKAPQGFYAREGLACVGISWLVMSLLGCLPFYLSGQIPSYLDALFEIVSGFTTTGASILPAVENLSRGILYWRSFSHWVGGMGVLVFLLAIVPAGGHSSGFTMHLLRAESPGPNVGKLVPKMRQTALILYMLYVLLTILDFIFLLLGHMPVFDALCTAFGTAGTGGFGIKNDSMASYSPYLQNVCTVFMLLFGVNFSCYYLLLLRRVRDVFSDEELRFYLCMVVGATALIVWDLRGFYATLGETVRHAAFQVATVVTTTGFATTDFDVWPAFSKAILLCLMLVGACAGSTGGGMKCARVMLLFKGLHRNIHQVLHPQSVEVVRVNKRPVSENVLTNTNAYLSAYVFIVIFSYLLISLDGFSSTTNFSAVMACFNNIGPGFDAVGPTCNFSGFSAFSKIVLILDMLAGRLEIFPVLVLFTRSTWKHG